MKRKGIILATSIFSCAALLATGFAAFVITTITAADVNGQIQVDTVVDNSFKVEKLSDPSNINFCASGSYTGTWLNYQEDSDGEVEALTTTFKISCTNSDKLNQTTPFEVEITESTGKYAAALAEGIVGELPTSASFVREAGTNNWTVSITFSWGEFFDYKNPIAFYADKDPNESREQDGETYAKEAIRVLDGGDTVTTAYEALGEAQYTVKITPKSGV